MVKKDYQIKDVGGLLNDAIIGLQNLQMNVRLVDDTSLQIGVALSELEHKLHIVSDLLENEE